MAKTMKRYYWIAILAGLAALIACAPAAITRQGVTIDCSGLSWSECSDLANDAASLKQFREEGKRFMKEAAQGDNACDGMDELAAEAAHEADQETGCRYMTPEDCSFLRRGCESVQEMKKLGNSR